VPQGDLYVLWGSLIMAGLVAVCNVDDSVLHNQCLHGNGLRAIHCVYVILCMKVLHVVVLCPAVRSLLTRAIPA
jgi:hypothetical protein